MAAAERCPRIFYPKSDKLIDLFVLKEFSHQHPDLRLQRSDGPSDFFTWVGDLSSEDRAHEVEREFITAKKELRARRDKALIAGTTQPIIM